MLGCTIDALSFFWNIPIRFIICYFGGRLDILAFSHPSVYVILNLSLYYLIKQGPNMHFIHLLLCIQVWIKLQF